MKSTIKYVAENQICTNQVKLKQSTPLFKLQMLGDRYSKTTTKVLNVIVSEADHLRIGVSLEKITYMPADVVARSVFW